MASTSKKEGPAIAEIKAKPGKTCVSVNPGICGFRCRIETRKIDKNIVSIKIFESECRQIQQFCGLLSKIALRELFMPITRNPVYKAAEQSGCHPSCPIPAAVLKAVEVSMEMALPQDVSIRFEPCKGEKD